MHTNKYFVRYLADYSIKNIKNKNVLILTEVKPSNNISTIDEAII